MLYPKNTFLQEKTTFDVGLEMWVSVGLEEVRGTLKTEDQCEYTPKWQRDPSLIEV